MTDAMTFPDSVEQFMEQYKITDTKQIYTNGTDLVPIFRMKQWFEHLPSAQRTGTWIYTPIEPLGYICSECRIGCCRFKYCPNCGARMEGE